MCAGFGHRGRPLCIRAGLPIILPFFPVGKELTGIKPAFLVVLRPNNYLGRTLEGVGVTPDVAVELSREALAEGVDPPLSRVLEELRSL